MIKEESDNEVQEEEEDTLEIRNESSLQEEDTLEIRNESTIWRFIRSKLGMIKEKSDNEVQEHDFQMELFWKNLSPEEYIQIFHSNVQMVIGKLIFEGIRIGVKLAQERILEFLSEEEVEKEGEEEGEGEREREGERELVLEAEDELKYDFLNIARSSFGELQWDVSSLDYSLGSIGQENIHHLPNENPILVIFGEIRKNIKLFFTKLKL
jgi:hypothetical protein